MGAETDAVMTQAALVEVALRLVEDNPEIAAGSVLRCYLRAVRLVRLDGTPTSQLPIRAEALTAQMLAARI